MPHNKKTNFDRQMKTTWSSCTLPFFFRSTYCIPLPYRMPESYPWLRNSGSRRAKTAVGNSRGAALGGLAIRDLTPPGFLPPKGAHASSEGVRGEEKGGNGSQTSPGAAGVDGDAAAANTTADGAGAAEQKPVGFERPPPYRMCCRTFYLLAIWQSEPAACSRKSRGRMTVSTY